MNNVVFITAPTSTKCLTPLAARGSGAATSGPGCLGLYKPLPGDDPPSAPLSDREILFRSADLT